MTIYSRSSLQNFDNRRFWLWTKISVFDWKTWKSRHKTFKWSKRIFGVIKYYGWCLWEYWRLLLNKTKKNLNYFWWHDCRHYEYKNFQAVVKELFIRCIKLNTPLAFNSQSFFFCSKRHQIKFNSLFDHEN